MWQLAGGVELLEAEEASLLKGQIAQEIRSQTVIKVSIDPIEAGIRREAK